MGRWLLLLSFTLSLLSAACQGCRGAKANGGESHAPDVPTVRLYLLSNVAGALEPCGCSKDQLGGLDHLAAYLAAERTRAPNSLVLAAGPLLFIDPRPDADHVMQDSWKAESIAEAMKDIGLAAWAPGFNDWAAGAELLERSANEAGAVILAAGGARQGSKLFDVSGFTVGVFGISDPRDPAGRYPSGVTGVDREAAVASAGTEAARLQQGGARLLVALTTLERGAALRIADALPTLHVLLIGKPSSQGHGNTPQPPPEMIGNTLVVETANHAQTVAVVDVFARGRADGALELADTGGVARATKITDLSRRIRELEGRINSWDKGGKIEPKDLAARKSDLEKLRAEKAVLELQMPAPQTSFFRYHVEEIREKLGSNEAVAARMRAYYKRVNEHNKTALADRKPSTPAEGEASYVGLEECTSCHSEEREVWDKTPHAKAYKTLADDFKEYNLDCVGCHVTGYGKPGGSTVTHNAALKDVQCETCHGPGSLHTKQPEAPKLIVLEPDPKSCVEQCHHPPHVEGFDPKAKMELVLGPGHR